MEHKLLYSFCYYLGHLLNIIPGWIADKESTKESSKINNFLKILFICFILLLIDLIETTVSIIVEKEENKNEKKYDDDFIVIEYLVIFLFYKYGKEVYYKHQNISFQILILVEAIKTIYFFIKEKSYEISDIMIIILVMLNSILYSIYYLYIKGLMKYNFISPYKCNYMIGIITVPLIIIIYIIISFTPLGKYDNDYYCDNIFDLFRKGISGTKNIISLISLPFSYGILLFFLNKIIYDYTIYHIYIPILIEYFIRNIFKNLGFYTNIILISSFLVELIMILILVEIIEINYCGLNENVKRNIEIRGFIDSSLNDELDDDFDGKTNFNETEK